MCRRATVVFALLAALLVVAAAPGVAGPPASTVGSTHSTDSDFNAGSFTGDAGVHGSGEDAYIRATGSGSETFSATGSEQAWTVPAGADTVTVKLWGAGGGSADAGGAPGGYVEGELPVTGGETLYVYVGETDGGFGGGAGGKSYGGGGGGATDIRQGNNSLSDRVVVAGGGGGGAGGSNTYEDFGGGGAGGGSSADDGGDASDGGNYANGAGGGDQSSGGSGGSASYYVARDGDSGRSGSGGSGGDFDQGPDKVSGGGGGGGYYGGGGGGAAVDDDHVVVIGGGGGGGSSYTGGLSSVTSNTKGGGSPSDTDGRATIEYELDGTGSYVSANHTVEDSVSGFANLTVDSDSATVTWEGWDGSSWTTLDRTTYSTTGNHTSTWSQFSGEKVRVTVTFHGDGVELHDEGVSFTDHEPGDPPEETPTSGGDGGDGRAGDDDDGAGSGGGAGGGSGGGRGGDRASGPAVEVTGDSADRVRVEVQDASRGDPVTVRLPSRVGRTGPGAALTTLRITSGGPSDFEIVARHTGEPPTDTPALADETAQAGLAYVTLDHGLSDDDVATARLTVRVEKATLDAWGADPASVTLYRYEDGGWASYDTRRVGEDPGAYYVSATFPGLSRFAVGVDRTVTLTQTRTEAASPTAAPPGTGAAAGGSGGDDSPAGASGDEDPPAGAPVESQSELGLGVLAIFGLLAILFGAGYVGGGWLLRRYENR